MLAVQNKPQPSVYNSLLDVEDSDNDLKSLNSSDILSALGSVIIRHGIEDKIGIRLLHKHNTLDNDELMLEEEEVDCLGRNCLSTVATSYYEGIGVFANSWKLHNDKFIAMEYSSDRLVGDVYRSICHKEEFLSNISTLIRSFKVSNILGLCAVPRSFHIKFKFSDDLLLIERTDDVRRANILRYENPVEINPKSLIKTSWIFKKEFSSETGTETVMGCVKENCVTHTACVIINGKHDEQTHHSSQHRRT